MIRIRYRCGRSYRRSYLWLGIEYINPFISEKGSKKMTVVQEFLKANEVYSANFQKGDLPLPPGRNVAVLACMDARLDPARVLGLEEGDAHVIRNAGGRAADALRSLVISEQLLGTNTIVILHR